MVSGNRPDRAIITRNHRNRPTMATTSTTHTITGRTVAVIATTVLLVLAAVLLIGALSVSPDATTTSRTATPATASGPDRGTGDPCALRHETRGGFLEGLDPANRCPTSSGQPRTGGRLP